MDGEDAQQRGSMTPLQSWLRTALLSILTGALLLFGWNLYPHIAGAVDAWGNAAPDLKPTLDAIAGPRGTLHEINKAVVKVGDVVVTTQLQARAITPHTLAAVDSLATIAPHANALMDSAAKTADSATVTLDSASTALQTANTRIGPLLDAYTASGRDLDTLILENGPSVKRVLLNVSDITADGHVILFNAATVSTKAKDDYMKARTPWGRFVTTGLDLIHLGAYAAR